MTSESTFILIGHPVGHSLSPAIHGAAYAHLGLSNHRYVAVDCPDEAAVRAQVAALRRGEIEGANVTVPWKRLALELADSADESAHGVGAANVLRAENGPGGRRIVAYNTDVPALAAELDRGRPGARVAAVIGSGGAALAAVAACRSLGVLRVHVVARKFKGDRAAWERAAEFARLGATPLPWPDAGGASEWRDAAGEADLVVQTTSDGMLGATDGTTVARLVPWAALPRDAFAYDAVYNPAVTPFVAAARAAGVRAESGLGMLVGQAAVAIELWLGVKPPDGPLRAAAQRVLDEKTRR
jgi:shikimate dehydrogenase